MGLFAQSTRRQTTSETFFDKAQDDVQNVNMSTSLAVPVGLSAPVRAAAVKIFASLIKKSRVGGKFFSSGVKYSAVEVTVNFQLPDFVILKMDGTVIRYSRAAHKDCRVYLDNNLGHTGAIVIANTNKITYRPGVTNLFSTESCFMGPE